MFKGYFDGCSGGNLLGVIKDYSEGSLVKLCFEGSLDIELFWGSLVKGFSVGSLDQNLF